MAYSLPGVISGPRRWLLARLVGNGVLQATITLTAAALVHRAFDRLVRHSGEAQEPMTQILVGGLGLLACAVVLAFLRTIERSDAERMGQGYVTELRMVLFDCLSAMSLRGMQRRSRGVVVLRFIGDLKMLRQYISLGLARILVAAIATVLALAALAYADPGLATAAGVVIGLGLLALSALGERTRSAMREARRRQGYLSANINEKVASIAVMQAFGQTVRERSHLLRQSERLRDAMVEQARRSAALRAIADVTAATASAAVLLVGALEVVLGATTPAVVVAAMTVVAMLVPRLRDLGHAFGYWNGAQLAWRKLEEFLASPGTLCERAGAPGVALTAGNLEFRGVKVAGALREFSAVAQAGKLTAIVGPNASGKSTLLALAARLLDPDAGQVLLDGQDLATHSLRSVRRCIGMVSPDLPPLRGTIEKNLRYRWPEASDAAQAEVRALCGIDEMLAELPQGIETRVAEGGINLSFGQRQRIVLARALLGKPPLLLLDEADANLDARSSKILERILSEYAGTVVLVTHRLDRAAAADEIWYVENGMLVESGPPDKLLRRTGPTARLLRNHVSLAG